MRELSVNEVGFVSGGLIGAPPGPYLSSGSSGSSGSGTSLPGCSRLSGRAQLVCNILGGDVVAEAVWGALSQFGDALSRQAQTNPLPPIPYGGVTPPPGHPGFMGPPAPVPRG
jgi:hypothetical protein